MIEYSKALEIIFDALKPLPVSAVRLEDACGTVAAAAVPSLVAVPPFDNSAMDGFAVRAADTEGASETDPIALNVVGIVTAGEAAAIPHDTAGSTWEIMTGAPIPAGYDSVVPVERVLVELNNEKRPATIKLTQPVAAGRNLRKAGEDFAANDTILNAGQSIQAGQVMGLAATGVHQLPARQPARVAAVTTGNELTDAASERSLESGMIHDANGPYLEAAIGSINATSAGVFRSSDSAEEFTSLIQALKDKADVIMTTGGVSAGRIDFVPKALAELGAEILFHKVAIRPGKPLLLARLPDGTLVFGLPGNPIAVAVGLRFFVIPALRRMQGLPDESYLSARLKTPVGKKMGMRFFGKAQARYDEHGQLEVELLPGQESFKIKPLMAANCWLLVDEDTEEAEAGNLVRIAPLYPETFP